MGPNAFKFSGFHFLVASIKHVLSFWYIINLTTLRDKRFKVKLHSSEMY